MKIQYDIDRFFKNQKYKIQKISYYLLASVLGSLIGIFINPFMAIGLSNNDYAILGYYASFGFILSPLLAFSLNSYYARNYYLVDADKRDKMFQTILSLFLIFGLLIFLIFFCGYYFYHKNFVFSISLMPYALLSFAPVYFSSFYSLYILNLRMQDKAKAYAFITVINALIGAFLSLLLVFIFRFGAEGRLIALLINAVLFAIYTFKTIKFHFILDKSIIIEALSFCWPITISAILSFFFLGIDRTFLAQINDNHTLGLYNIGIQISAYIGIFGTVILQTFEPDLFRYTSLNQHKKVFYLVVIIMTLTIIPNLLFIFVSAPLVNILTYGKYTAAIPFVNILCLRNVATIFAFQMYDVVIGYGYSRIELYNRILGSFLAVIAYKYLIKNWGFYGAAWGQSISWLVMGLISMTLIIFLIYKKRANN